MAVELTRGSGGPTSRAVGGIVVRMIQRPQLLDSRARHWRGVGRSGPGQLPLLALMLVASVLATGCGFQLRGGIDAPESLRAVHVSGSESELTRILEQTLSAAGVRLVDAADAPITLTLANQNETPRTRSVTAGIQAAEYELAGQVEFGLTGQDGVVLLAPTPLTVSRVFRRDPNGLLANSREEALIWREIRADLAASLLRSVSAAIRRFDAP